jgi:dienelactone hydrolase
MQRLMLMAGLWMLGSLAWAGLQTEELEYRVGDTVMTGYLAYDAEADLDSWERMQRFFDRIFAGAGAD